MRVGAKRSAMQRVPRAGQEAHRRASPSQVWRNYDTTVDTQVLPQSGLTLHDRGDGTSYKLRERSGLSRWRVTYSPALKVSVADYYYAKRWWRWKALKGDGSFTAPSGVLSLITPSGTHRYRGELRNNRPSPTSSDRDTVNVLGIDDYVRGVVPAEMPASWKPAAVQAQAVAARTYAIFERAANLNRHYQICDTTSCQVYKGVDGEHSLSDAAVAATKGLYLTYQGAPAFTQFSASSGGWTADGGKPYLPTKADPYDAWSGNKVHTWTTTVNESTLERRYPSIGDLRSVTVTRRSGSGDWQGRVESLKLTGSKGSTVISGNTFRSIYGLRSNWFAIG